MAQLETGTNAHGRTWLMRGIRGVGLLLTVGGTWGFVSTLMNWSSGLLVAVLADVRLNLTAILSVIAGVGVVRLRESGRVLLLLLAWLQIAGVLITAAAAILWRDTSATIRVGSVQYPLTSPFAFGLVILGVLAVDFAIIAVFSLGKKRGIFID